jgi:Flp pilus assembly protein TadD
MRVGGVGVRILAAVCLIWLTGCETTQNGVASNGDGNLVTGSIGEPAPPPPTPESTGLMGEDPNDDLSLGKKYYRQNSFGLAEQHFRRAVEKGPKSLEAWIGLAASYDKLRRFDLADRAYEQCIKLAGPTPEILNNQGYSYILRGDRRRARATLTAALAKDPGNPYIRNNLELLDESQQKKTAAQ